MDKHFYVINKKGLFLCFLLIIVNVSISAFSLVKLLSGGSKFWLIPIIIFITFLLISSLIMVQVVTAGIDVRRKTVIMPDLDPRKGKCPQFSLNELDSICLMDGENKILNPEIDSLHGARVTFLLKDGTQKQYYPMSITKKQYKSIESGIMSLVNELNNDDFFND